MKPYKELPKDKKQVKLPQGKSSIYELSRKQCERYYRSLVIEFYPAYEVEIMTEYSMAIRDEPEGLDGIRMQLSSLMAYWFWWI